MESGTITDIEGGQTKNLVVALTDDGRNFAVNWTGLTDPRGPGRRTNAWSVDDDRDYYCGKLRKDIHIFIDDRTEWGNGL
jgi:hypothetical protein